MAPFIFVITSDYCLIKTVDSNGDTLCFTIVPEKSKIFAAKKVADVDFVDDILSDDIAELQDIPRRTESETALVRYYRMIL